MSHPFPLEPLLALTGGNLNELARRSGVDRGQLTRDKREGLSLVRADRIAVALGQTPANLWPLEWAAVEDSDDGLTECADEKCSVRFLPRRKGHRYCSKVCADRVASREWHRRHRGVAATLTDRPCVKCGEMFSPCKFTPRQRFCSVPCSQRWHAAESYKRNRDKRRARMARYDAEVRELKAKRNAA